MGGVGEDKFVTAVELPVHEVGLRAFELSLHPVTRRQWGVANSGEIGGADLPMTSVSFPEAEDFAKRMDARLPTEAEWEYACRAGSMTLFPTGPNLLPEDANFFYDEGGDPVGGGSLTPVGKHRPNAFGLYDMIGNVLWVSPQICYCLSQCSLYDCRWIHSRSVVGGKADRVHSIRSNQAVGCHGLHQHLTIRAIFKPRTKVYLVAARTKDSVSQFRLGQGRCRILGLDSHDNDRPDNDSREVATPIFIDGVHRACLDRCRRYTTATTKL